MTDEKSEPLVGFSSGTTDGKTATVYCCSASASITGVCGKGVPAGGVITRSTVNDGSGGSPYIASFDFSPGGGSLSGTAQRRIAVEGELGWMCGCVAHSDRRPPLFAAACRVFRRATKGLPRDVRCGGARCGRTAGAPDR